MLTSHDLEEAEALAVDSNELVPYIQEKLCVQYVLLGHRGGHNRRVQNI